MRGSCIAAAVAVAGLLAPLPGERVRADSLGSTYDQPLGETLHTTTIDLGDDVATYTVRRRLKNEGDRAEEATIVLDLPRGGVVAGLRIADGSRWFDAKLLPYTWATGRWEELLLSGKAPPRLAALLEWEEVGLARLRLFPILANEEATVEYSVRAPLHLHGGRVYLHVPPAIAGGKEPVVRVKGASDVREVPAAELPDLDTEDGWNPDPDGRERWLSVLPKRGLATGEIRVRQGVSSLSTGRAIWRLEVDAAAELGAVPQGAKVVFVLDASYTEDVDGIRAQLQLVRGYLSHVPDAKFEIVLYRRRAARLVGSFARATEIDEILDGAPAATFTPSNGSHLDAGLELAVELLAAEKGPTRIVAMTDGLYRESLGSDRVQEALARARPDTVIHFVHREASAGAFSEEPIDDDVLVPVTEARGGLAVAIAGDDPDPAALARITRGLVRPIRLDDLVVVSGGVPGVDLPDTLFEGGAVRRFELVDDPPLERITLEGTIWGRRWRKTVEVDEALSAQIPSLVFGHALSIGLEDREAIALARLGGVVSPHTSLLAEQPGAGPSRAGSDDPPGELDPGHGWGHGVGRGYAGWAGHGAASTRDASGFLHARLEPGVAACAARAGRRALTVDVTVESTYDEIVDVVVTGTPDARLRACIEEASWGVRLDARFVERLAKNDVRIAIDGGASAREIDLATREGLP